MRHGNIAAHVDRDGAGAQVLRRMIGARHVMQHEAAVLAARDDRIAVADPQEASDHVLVAETRCERHVRPVNIPHVQFKVHERRRGRELLSTRGAAGAPRDPAHAGDRLNRHFWPHVLRLRRGGVCLRDGRIARLQIPHLDGSVTRARGEQAAVGRVPVDAQHEALVSDPRSLWPGHRRRRRR